MNKKKHIQDLAFLAAVLILVLVLLCSGLRVLESAVLVPRTEESVKAGKTVAREGIRYFPRQDITVVLVMGIDQHGPVSDSEAYSNRGAADLVMLLLFDETGEKCDILHLNRDTMVEMPVLGIGGRTAGTHYGQLALSHTYGSGLEDSCENTCKTVSRFLGGIHIDHYVAMNMGAVSILNDAVGGVCVNVAEDFSQVDASIGRGLVTLKGEQAIRYVQTRKDVGDQLNLSRMERQQEYIAGFAAAFRKKQAQDPEFFVKTYEKVEPYLVTDCSVNVIAGMIDRYGAYGTGEVVTPEGRNVMGEKYLEFYVEEEKLDELVLRLFYRQKTEQG